MKSLSRVPHIAHPLLIGAVTLAGFMPGSMRADCPTNHYDLYVARPLRPPVQVTSTASSAEFNAVWNGEMLVHDVVVFDDTTCEQLRQDLYVTDPNTGETWPLTGGEGGNDASVSRDGALVAFDHSPVGDWSVYLLDWNGGAGGTPRLVREEAETPDLSPSSQLIVFRQHSDGAIITRELKTGLEHTIASFGYAPAWSPSGEYIAFDDAIDIYVIAVDKMTGAPLGEPTRLTDGSANGGQSTWSVDGRTLLFHSNRGGGDFDIWAVPAAGGQPRRVTGLEETHDYDPELSSTGRGVVFSGSTP